MKEYQASYIRAVKNESVSHKKGPDFLNPEAVAPAYHLHQSFEEYSPTPLVCLKGLTQKLGVKAVFVKDESKRFGLNAFKGLGGLYALTRIICRELGLDETQVTFRELKDPRWKERIESMEFVTATDGNHGKGVAWTASMLGCRAHVYMPAGSSEIRAEAIRGIGNTEVKIMETGYDDTVRYAAEMADKNGWHLVQDTSWKGYEEIPSWIIQGYTTMGEEAVQQLEEAGYKRPTHVFLQAGVGAMAGSIVGYLANRYEENRPVFAVVEPENMACIYQSARMNDGKPHPAVDTGPTMMAGLNCGEPCTVTWPVLRDYVEWYYTCPDYISAYGMRILRVPEKGDNTVISGESGAVTTGLLCALCGDKELGLLKEMAGVDKDAVILLFSTEGDTDPDNYRRIIYEGKNS